VRPGSQEPLAVPLLEASRVGPEDCYVPAGWFTAGGDPLAADSLPEMRVWVDGFVMKKHPVTQGEYRHWMDAMVAAGDMAGAEAARRPQSIGSSSYCFEMGRDGLYAYSESLSPELSDDRAPAVMVTWRQAQAYVAHRAAHDPLAWRLPDELEWEKAARGTDARAFVWSNHPEPTWANVVGCRDGPTSPCPADEHPEDVSPCGVRGLAGNVRDWCQNRWQKHGPPVERGILQVIEASPDDDRHRAVRGGGWLSMMHLSRGATRMGDRPGECYRGLGFRLAARVS
jgi:formylglycine-generating enzyme required for sulfatase activity